MSTITSSLRQMAAYCDLLPDTLPKFSVTVNPHSQHAPAYSIVFSRTPGDEADYPERVRAAFLQYGLDGWEFIRPDLASKTFDDMNILIRGEGLDLNAIHDELLTGTAA